MNGSTNELVSVPTIEVVCEGGIKRTMQRVNPDAPIDDKESGTVEMGKKNGGLYSGYAVKNAAGEYEFTPVTRLVDWTTHKPSNDNFRDPRAWVRLLLGDKR